MEFMIAAVGAFAFVSSGLLWIFVDGMKTDLTRIKKSQADEWEINRLRAHVRQLDDELSKHKTNFNAHGRHQVTLEIPLDMTAEQAEEMVNNARR